ncbi:MAG: aromatic-ring-hydroxylating dioxygenase subunit beta [Rhodospirillaceae bacterium]|nr:aromatic-ring-hydroxylating dioxygenase subunit beta [Rhodospirillaceae bacterium]MDD9914097.1 aromatic-ring-hydroxylating dioxygenase subunit beta [Rhodospirillaceae bacterium]MDD9926370.1 aromatic-ring-hydroxylating dioxygenase subunit beta [Rhodospirillaceae bacterium]
MNGANGSYDAVRDLLYLEADLLDRREWTGWADLYTEDCVYWVPSWATEDELTDDPELEVNMIYLTGKPALEARLYRLTSGQSYATAPLARTSHLVDTVRVVKDEGDTIEASAKWMTLCNDPRWGKQVRGGWYDYTLRRAGEALKIQRKKITLLESVIDGAIDIHQI